MTKFKPVLYPDFNILRLSHVEFAVKDIKASRTFYADVLGLQITDEDSDVLYLRAMEERGHHSLILRQSSNHGQANALVMKTYGEEDLDKAKLWFEKRDIPTQWVERPYQGRTLRAHDLFGTPLEFYYEMERLAPIHQKYALYKGVKPLRIDHFNMFSPDVDKSAEFYNSMGFRMTEYTEDEETGRLWAAWMHRKGTVHDIAFTNGTGPRLHHTAYYTANPLNIIELLDIMSTSGYMSHIERGPGRHGISNAFFLYLLDPDGFRIELYSSDYQTVDPDLEPIKWDLKDPQRQTLWGTPAPRSWFEHGSLFEGGATQEAKLEAQPIIAP